jgi:hypothetical protein
MKTIELCECSESKKCNHSCYHKTPHQHDWTCFDIECSIKGEKVKTMCISHEYKLIKIK